MYFDEWDLTKDCSTVVIKSVRQINISIKKKLLLTYISIEMIALFTIIKWQITHRFEVILDIVLPSSDIRKNEAMHSKVQIFQMFFIVNLAPNWQSSIRA